MFRIKINQSKPPWRIKGRSPFENPKHDRSSAGFRGILPLKMLILAALVLAPSAYLAANSRVLAASDPEIIVEDADSVQEFDLVEPAETLLNLADQVMPRIIIHHAEQIIHHDLIQVPADVSILADRVQPHIIVQHAEQIIRHNLIQVPADVSILADRVRPHIIVQHAEQIIRHNFIAIPMPQFAINAIAEAREAIAAGIAEGLNMTEAETLLSRAEVALAAGDFGEAISRARQAEAKAEGIKGDAEAAIEEIAEARVAIEAGSAEGLDMADAEGPLRQAERALARGDFEEAIILADQAEVKAQGIKADAEAAIEHIAVAREVIEAGIAEGLDMADAEALLSRAEGALARGDFGRAISLAEQAETKAEGIRGDAEVAIEDIAQARAAIEAGTAEGLDMAEAEALLSRAEGALARGDFGEAISLARQAEPKVEGIRRIAALEQIDEAKEAIATGRAAGLDMADPEDILWLAEGAFQAGDHRRARSLAKQAELTAQEVKGEAQTALDGIYQARDAIEQGIAKRLDMTGAEDVLGQAEKTLVAGDFGGAISLARQAKAKAEEITRELRLARDCIEEARQVISEERARGFDVVEAESSLSQAKSAFDDREYERAVQLAATAKSLALDVDGDGALNYQDFAPTINNNHIYGGAFLLVLGLISASAALSFRRRRKKAEKEQEEKVKSEILAMIDEVVNEGRG